MVATLSRQRAPDSGPMWQDRGGSGKERFPALRGEHGEGRRRKVHTRPSIELNLRRRCHFNNSQPSPHNCIQRQSCLQPFKKFSTEPVKVSCRILNARQSRHCSAIGLNQNCACAARKPKAAAHRPVPIPSPLEAGKESRSFGQTNQQAPSIHHRLKQMRQAVA